MRLPGPLSGQSRPAAGYGCSSIQPVRMVRTEHNIGYAVHIFTLFVQHEQW
jgi:hypothetical protein